MIRREPRRRKPALARQNASFKIEAPGSIAGTLAVLDQLAPQSPKAKKIVAMLRSWLEDESGYDEQTWPKLKKSLDCERKKIDARRLFDG